MNNQQSKPSALQIGKLPLRSRGPRPCCALHFQNLPEPCPIHQLTRSSSHPPRKVGGGTSPTSQMKNLMLAFHNLLKWLIISQLTLNPELSCPPFASPSLTALPGQATPTGAGHLLLLIGWRDGPLLHRSTCSDITESICIAISWSTPSLPHTGPLCGRALSLGLGS